MNVLCLFLNFWSWSPIWPFSGKIILWSQYLTEIPGNVSIAYYIISLINTNLFCLSYVHFQISVHEVPVEAFFRRELSTFLPQYLNEVPGIVCTSYCIISLINTSLCWVSHQWYSFPNLWSWSPRRGLFQIRANHIPTSIFDRSTRRRFWPRINIIKHFFFVTDAPN